MSNKAIKRARERLINWSARGDVCPICNKEFRYGCNHTVTQAINRLEENIINMIVKKNLKG